jgi:hypothetical protein
MLALHKQYLIVRELIGDEEIRGQNVLRWMLAAWTLYLCSRFRRLCTTIRVVSRPSA